MKTMKKKLFLIFVMQCSIISCGVDNISSGLSNSNKISTNLSTTSYKTSTKESSSNSTNKGGSSMGNSSTSNNSSSSISKKINDGYVVYINLDGFGKYYYDEAKTKNLVPTLESIKNEGVVFNNLSTLSPSITNPCQAMIVSGASSSETRNVYRYYDKKNDIVVQQARENDADTLYHSVIRNSVSSATVHHFPAESTFSTTNVNSLYVKTPFGEVSNYAARFDQAIKIVKGQQFKNDSTYMVLPEVPKFLTIYCDDLDALGHNESAYDTFSLANSKGHALHNIPIISYLTPLPRPDLL